LASGDSEEGRKGRQFSLHLPRQNSFFSCTGWPVTYEDSGALHPVGVYDFDRGRSRPGVSGWWLGLPQVLLYVGGFLACCSVGAEPSKGRQRARCII